MPYNATLCKEAWEKKLPAQVTQCTCYCINNCDGNFFRSVGKEWQLKYKPPFYTKIKGCLLFKQTSFTYRIITNSKTSFAVFEPHLE
jgi:hypothetical protein